MKKYFNTPRQITQTVYDPITVDQLKELLDKYKPKEIWHPGWSNKVPCLFIASYNDSGFMGYWNWGGNKTPIDEPEQMSAESVFKHLKFQFFNLCYFEIPDEPAEQPAVKDSPIKKLLEKWRDERYKTGEQAKKDKSEYLKGVADGINCCIFDLESQAVLEQPKYNPAFIQGNPELSGWYIAAIEDKRNGLFDQLPLFFWSNTGKWCTVGSCGLETTSCHDDVVAYMPLPKYKL